MATDQPYVYVYNSGGGKFQFQRAREDDPRNHNKPTLIGPDGLCDGTHHLTSAVSRATRRCAGCTRADLLTVVKCTNCSFALCDHCSKANHIPGATIPSAKPITSSSASYTTTTVRQSVPAVPRSFFLDDTEEKVEDQQSFVLLHKHEKRGLFPAEQTLHFSLLKSGKSKDLSERLSLFVNSTLGSKENQVEHVSVKADLDLAWVVLRSPQVLQAFRALTGSDSTIDLLDGWRVKWQVYVPPKTRTVYSVTGLPSTGMAEIFCAPVRKLMEEQLKMSPADIDIVVATEGTVLVVFQHGEYDVKTSRSIFMPDGKELCLVPTTSTV